MYSKLLAAIFLLFCSSSFADEVQDVKTEYNGGTYLNLSVTERTEIQENILVANLSVEKDGADSQQVQNDINRLTLQAVTKAKALSNINVNTEQYYVYKSTTNKANSNAKTWHGTQRIQLQSSEAEALLKLVGDLQNMGLVVQGLSYTISPEKADQVRDAMIEKAITSLIKKAERVGDVINKKNVELVDINIGANYASDYPHPMMLATNKRSNNAEGLNVPPVAEPGKREVTITITAKVLLK